MPRRRFALSRRSFIFRISATGALAFSSPLRALGRPKNDPIAIEDFISRLTALFDDLEAPTSIGDRYLDLYPDDDTSWLFGLLENDRSSRRAGRLRAKLAELIRQDFNRRDIALVDGWVLARTEARLCALVSLSASSLS